MSQHNSTQIHSVGHYTNIWFGILILFVVSITASQVIGYRPLMLVVAFGIATIQALMVAAYFMHLKQEKKYIHYLLLSMLTALALMYLGMQQDNAHPYGKNWTTTDTLNIIQEHKNNPAKSEHKTGH